MAQRKIRRSKANPRRPRRPRATSNQFGVALVRSGFVKSVPMTVFSGITDHKITINVTMMLNQSTAPFIGTSGNREVNPILWLSSKYEPFKDRVYTTAMINPRSIAVATVQKYMGINLYEAEMQKLRLYQDLQFSITSVALYLPPYSESNDIQLNRASLSYDAGKQTLGRTGNALVQSSSTGIPYVKISSGPTVTWNHISEVSTHDFIIVNHSFDEYVHNLSLSSSTSRTRAKLGYLVVSLRFNMSPYEVHQSGNTKEEMKPFVVHDQHNADQNTVTSKVMKLSLGSK